MRNGIRIAALAALMVAVLAFGTGCRRVRLEDRPETRTTTQEKDVALEGAEALETEVNVKVGELELTSTEETGVAMTGGFTFAPRSWEPEVDYRLDGATGRLVVAQPSGMNVDLTPFRNTRNTWDVRLPQGVPTALTLRVDVGRADVDLRGIDLTSLDARTGVGDTVIDLSGDRVSDLEARIESSVGKLVLKLPKGVGVRVRGEEGVGGFTADGFVSKDGDWINGAYGGPGPKIEIDLIRGVGDVTLELVG